MKKMLVLCLMVGMVAVVSCSSSSSSVNPDLPEVDYVGVAKDVAPVFTAPAIPATSIVKVEAEDVPTWGDRAFEIAVIFADDTKDVFGVNNIYNSITQTQDAYESFYGNEDLASYAFTKTIVAPFFGTEMAYEYATNYSADDDTMSGGVAIKYASNVAYALVTNSNDSDHTERGAIEASYNEDTKVLLMDVVSYNDYDVEQYTGTNKGKFIMRMSLNGVEDTHTFNELKVVKYNPGAGPDDSDGYYINIVGKGISQGAGKYFLFKITDLGGNDPAVTNKYFCVPSDNLTDEITLTPLDEGDVVGTDCEVYLEDVVAMVPFETNNDLPSKAFSAAIPGDPKEYVMINPIPTP